MATERRPFSSDIQGQVDAVRGACRQLAATLLGRTRASAEQAPSAAQQP